MSSHALNMGAELGQVRCPMMPTYGAPSIMFVRGQGTELWDSQGERYLDFVGGLAVQSLGHANPEVAEAISEQAMKLTQVSNYWATEHAHHVALELDRHITGAGSSLSSEPEFPSGQVFFCNSGAEANELAFKLARKSTGSGQFEILTAMGSFHGRTLAALAACGQPHKHEPFEPMPSGFYHFQRDEPNSLEALVTSSTAAIHVEPIQGEGGVWPSNKPFMSRVQELSLDNNVLFMVDEVQSGLCRTGKWFAFQHFGVKPDVVCIAKALGNGFPIAAVWARAEVASAFQAGDHGSTYGGNPLGTAAARKVLEIMARDNYPQKASALGSVLSDALADLPRVVSVRGMGGMLAAELDGEISANVALQATENGLLVNPITPTAIRLTPPLSTSLDHVDEAMSILKGVLHAQAPS
jgi:acetylornithine/N-succinyldiaminopimelate aminotransferase|tara:strand:+ start:3749 stop:4981 length:1233 start_codon:yes stop_codon:yes gene_type:complete